MPIYKAPLEDVRFVLDEIVGAGKLAELPGYEDATPDLIAQVLEEGAKLCEEVLFPLNQSGDGEGCTFENGVVRTPKGFKEAYSTYIEAGWQGLSCDPAYGGQGLPKLVNTMLEEFICSANLSFGMYPGLSLGAYNALSTYGSEELKQRFLGRLVDGTWAGTMCLTEPHCGTDLGLIRTKAVPQEDGSHKITGTKIFISAGEHDLTENILHLVLARLPDAPAGTRGISLFLVPKFLPKEDGSVGPRNGVACGSIEHKMGIKASATCVMNFEDATGWLVGEPHKGMRAMFVMMNAARLAVGIQGLGVAEVSYQNAVAYAKERLQGRSLKGTAHPDKPADPIIVHPDVRRNLLTARAYTEGARALGALVGYKLDVAEKHADEKTRKEADEFVQLMTPIVKALFTDIGFESANIAVQVHGGHGFIWETGVEQYVRDARICQIYEGTNGIQALDLVGRKLPQDMGRLLRRFFHPVGAEIEADMEREELAEFVLPLAKAFAKLQQATAIIAQKGLKDPEEAGAAATDYLRLFGLVALGWMWLKMVKAATAKLAAGEGNAIFLEAKIRTARFYMAKLLPQTNALFITIMAGSKPLMEMEEAAF
ncbi:acyl-CoA dehydrogenase [Azospirillum brasilense]|uniref:3-methylmercaptopropionyl-CoA dehydrogenase n=1 Tax=Azospirillum brasilense TaxID=192 RepID=Q8KR36_AZOBR|nr:MULTISPECIES: acyl-CoA dehydrogenase C-terminal domain-containing protein [Azospirillum]AAL03980.1 acyl-CoA dehydrogenase [Azospirillum brasilense]ALJ37611.1 acyl-CoA dehydrogenase [Azospirillum brasilense]MDW7553820.1 acyl-CoA dehydrogenase C-terminal domain-containing protein [Azospirillum brasilense]MDW7592741.1 acyl-CoA dehydrogenase C-terminal domain-containing protein [Azospirillum brasilense]MDW7628272.1 acyl-CoA dehydrogenase C-terminal domain-containing protein [Azospirillum brasil